MRQHNAANHLPRFLVYWRQAGHQLFAFTASVAAPTPQAARDIAGRQVPRNSRILGVKQSAGTGLRTLHQGRWIA
jgi:hypothetical protein